MNAQEEYLRELAGNICIYLPGWDVGKVQPTSFQLNGAAGRGIIFWCCAGALTGAIGIGSGIRLEVSGVYDLNAYIGNEDKPRITLGVKKGPEAIARDVRRRFLPKYEAIYANALETHSEIMRLRGARARVLADLAQSFGWEIVKEKDGPIKRVEEAPYRSKLDAILGNSMRPDEEDGLWYVDLELKRIPVSVAFAIAEVLKEPVFPPEQLAFL